MKKYLLILTALLCLWSCSEDDTVDVTVMPAATTEGADTFGCLVDGWVYVGGRYYARSWQLWPNFSFREWPQGSFVYDTRLKEMHVRVAVKSDCSIRFTLLSPEEGKECVITNVRFDNEELADGTAVIHRFSTDPNVISITFGNGKRLTHGRFDVHYTSYESYPLPEPTEQ